MKIRIIEVTENYIKFSDNSMITFDHYEDCCEWNYADFAQLDDLARSYEFTTPLQFADAKNDSGFMFGDSRRMFFVPCYSEQNGYYSSDVNIWYNGKCQLVVDADII